MKLSMVVMLVASLTLAACGGGDSSSPPVIVTQILSDPAYDGDIARDPGGAFTVTQSYTQTVFAGIDPATGDEYRAFLDFPLGGPGGVPLNAVIASATLDIVIDSILPLPLTGTIPIRVDLVSFQPPTLLDSDFSRTALATLTIEPPISQFDLGKHVPVDVTFLMEEAQRLGLPDFQVRIMKDFGSVAPGLIEINDTTERSSRWLLAPLLEVWYF